jgi:hypothetical protein
MVRLLDCQRRRGCDLIPAVSMRLEESTRAADWDGWRELPGYRSAERSESGLVA